jgi:cellulose synthase/poly-beta-1,6-N-acetylglucosamine synthase-like glycosyltransferase
MSVALRRAPASMTCGCGQAGDCAEVGERRLDVDGARIGREVALTHAALVSTVVLFAATLVFIGFEAATHLSWVRAVQAVVLAAALGVMVYGSLVYFVTRRGYLRRRRVHLSLPGDELAAFARVAPNPSPALVLVPSYREERRVVRQALLSSALQEYARLRVVLLIDDPPVPGTAEDAELLSAARRLPAEVAAELAEPRRYLELALATLDLDAVSRRDGARDLAALYEWAAEWLDAKADAEPVLDHSDRFFAETVLRGRARRLSCVAAGLRSGVPRRSTLRAHRRLLASLFAVELTSFERKSHAGLSHEPNKAMNLNAYLSLLGRPSEELPPSVAAELTEQPEPVLADPAYVVTLDADSVLLPFYLTRLVGVLEDPGNERIAIAQTPYSSIPGASSRLERVAGATTDLQYVIHQGFTAHGATFWVGANAVIRKRALDEIATDTWEDGVMVRRYVHDRTVIEDTESSVDLAAVGWTLHNYPERLSYSATPPDFGALTVQRRRWANGGLIILPKSLRYLATSPGRAGRLAEGFLRTHYLASIAASNAAFLVLLLCPFDERLGPPWMAALGIPYLLLFARDLGLAGHRARHVLDVAALNLVLLPVNLGGVVKSLQQVLLGRKTPFGRTPKTTGRTPAPALYVLGVYGFIALTAVAALTEAEARHWWHAGFALATLALATYGAITFVGVRTAITDVRLTITARKRTRKRGINAGRTATETD